MKLGQFPVGGLRVWFVVIGRSGARSLEMEMDPLIPTLDVILLRTFFPWSLRLGPSRNIVE
jgi:hypothetical protein